ncbi:Arabinosidase A [Morchella snyderi]|nr:Arabinosidase A [Morchella snyderi]
MYLHQLAALLALVAAPALGQTVTPVHLKINTEDTAARNKTAPNLYGLFFEDINHSGDGGIYAELIRNRAFQGSGVKLLNSGSTPYPYGTQEADVPFGPNLDAWRAIGDVRLSIDLLNPLSDALPAVLRVDVGSSATGEVGFMNEGYWGMDVRPQKYAASFYVKPWEQYYSGALSAFKLSLRSNLTDDVWTTTEIPITGKLDTFDYTKLEATLVPEAAAPSINNSFAITMDAAEVKGQTFYFSLVSLFPPTFKDRPNGIRTDLAEALKGLDPKFLRFPGGNNLEGFSIQTRWKWNETIGDLRYRKGRVGQWEYFNTNGLGLLEYLDFCEDMEMQPLLTVYAGYTLAQNGRNPASTVPREHIQPFIDEVLDELEYILGDSSTPMGALRASHGRAETYALELVEIGNEDQFSGNYNWRFPLYYEQLKAKYPDITFIASAGPDITPKMEIPAGEMWDPHYYQTPQFYKNNFGLYDNFGVSSYQNVTIFVGEYSVLSVDSSSGNVQWSGPGRIVYPTLDAAIGEARIKIFGIGMERNPNTVKLSSYAPLFQNYNSYQWTPDLISFSADPNQTTLSASYYQQKLFSHHRGTETLPIAPVSGTFNPLWWAAQHDGGRDVIYVKLVNAANSAVPLTLEFDRAITGVNGTVLTHEVRNGFNYISNQTAISPQALELEEVEAGASEWVWEVPKASIVVLEFSS